MDTATTYNSLPELTTAPPLNLESYGGRPAGAHPRCNRPAEDLDFLQQNTALNQQQIVARAVNDLRSLGFLPPPGLFALKIDMNWHPEAVLPDGPDPCDPLL